MTEPTCESCASCLPFRQLFATLYQILRTVPRGSRDTWIQELKAKVAAKMPLTAEEFLTLSVLMDVGLVGVGNKPGTTPGSLRQIIQSAVYGLVAVPRDVCQAWMEELQSRNRSEERLTGDEVNILLLLIGLPAVEEITSHFLKQELAAGK